MKHHVRGRLAHTLVIALTGVLAACGTNGDEEAPDAGAMSSEPAAAAPAGGGAQAAGGAAAPSGTGGDRTATGSATASGSAAAPASAPSGDGPVGIGDVWDRTEHGVQVSLVYDPGYDVIMGRVQNGTDARLCGVRVTVHLEGGPDLGPTEARDVEPGRSTSIELPVGGVSFERWSAEAETSPCGD